MEQIIVNGDGKIISHIDAPILQKNGISVNNFTGLVGSYADEYNADWTLKKLSYRVALGRIQVPAGHKLNEDGSEFIAKTEIEKYIDCELTIPKGYRLSDDETEIVIMTIDELLTAGKITEDEAITLYVSDVKAKRKYLFTAYVDTVNAARWDAMTTEERSGVSSYRQALCDISKQSGYPSSVVWPDIPDFLT